MRRILSCIFAAALVSGCEPAAVRDAHQAEQRLAMIKASHGTKAEVCDAAREVSDAWLKALDQGKYDEAKLHSDMACLDADLERQLG